MDDEIYLPPNAYPAAYAPASSVPMPVPVAPPTVSIPKKVLNANQRSQLKQQGYTNGLIEALEDNCNVFPLRIWVIDNSGSMNSGDGNRLVATTTSNEVRSVPCTRWKEIQETIEYHIDMAALLQAPTIFRLLNDPGAIANIPQEFSIAGERSTSISDDVHVAKNTMQKAGPMGVTPLAEHVRAIKLEVERNAPSLRAEGKRVAVILATDGLPSNMNGISGTSELKEFTNTLRELEGLPIWLVIRLCTDDDEVVEFYNNLDNQLELSMEVIDFFNDEAKEMFDTNPWINYSLPIHRMRELGFQHRIFDLLDERKLTLSEVREYCMLLFGRGNFDGVPEPDVNFKGFLTATEGMMRNESQQWHPVKKKMKPLISLKKLNQLYGDGTCTIM